MVNVAKHIAYWRRSAEEDFEVAEELLVKKRERHALYFGQLALEKILKAHVTRSTGDVPPKSHNLLRLAQIANLTIPPGRIKVVARMMDFNIEGRYPESVAQKLAPDEARKLLTSAKEAFQWLISQL